MKTKLLLGALLIATNLIYAQQKTGKFASYEDYKKGKFMDTDEFEKSKVVYMEYGDIMNVIYFRTKSNAVVDLNLLACGNDSCKMANEKGKVSMVIKPWGYFNGAKLIRISAIDNKGIGAAMLQNEAAICLYSDAAFKGNPVLDNNGEILSLNSNEVYISKSITGEIYNLNKKNLAAMVQDDPELAEFVKSKKFGKLKFHYVMNEYNKRHK